MFELFFQQVKSNTHYSTCLRLWQASPVCVSLSQNDTLTLLVTSFCKQKPSHHSASLSRVWIRVAVVRHQGCDCSWTSALLLLLRQSFICFLCGFDMRPPGATAICLCYLQSHLCWYYTWGFLSLSDLWNLSITSIDFREGVSASDGGAGLGFDSQSSCAFADQGAVWGAQGFGHRCFFPLLAELMEQTARSASWCRWGGVEPRTRGNLFPLAVLLVLVRWLGRGGE